MNIKMFLRDVTKERGMQRVPPVVRRGNKMRKEETCTSGVQCKLKRACMGNGGGKNEMEMRRILSLVPSKESRNLLKEAVVMVLTQPWCGCGQPV